MIRRPPRSTLLSLHDALPIWSATVANFQVMMSEDKMNELFKQQEEINQRVLERVKTVLTQEQLDARSEEHTSELQSPCNLVCRLLLEKKKHIDYHPQLFISTP